VVDVAPLSLGIETAGGVMTKIIERSTTVPCSKQKVFSTYSDNQPAVTIQVYEGERHYTKDCNLLGKFNLEGIPPAPRGVPKIEVSFELDANGILTVKAEDKGTGKSQKVTISNETGRLTADQIKKMVEDAKRYEDEDKKAAQKTAAKNGFEGYLYGLRTSLSDSKLASKLPAADKKKLDSTVADAVKWLESHGSESQETYEAKQKELEAIANPIISKAYAGSGAPGGAEAGAGGESEGAAPGPGPGPTGGSTGGKGPTISEVD